MPTYEYACPVCGHKQDEFHMMSENPEFTCPKCGNSLKKGIHGGTNTLYKAPGFTQYKGRNGS
jgi:putative FmdB family regulatory protein